MTNIDDILRDLVKRLDEEDLCYLSEIVAREINIRLKEQGIESCKNKEEE